MKRALKKYYARVKKLLERYGEAAWMEEIKEGKKYRKLFKRSRPS